MNPRIQRRIQRYGWDRAAAHYDAGWQNSLLPAQQRLMALAAARAGETVLDVACGTGLVTFPLADAVGSTGRVVATDLSDAMVETVRTRARIEGQTHVDAFRADAESLDGIEQDCFDLVTCALGLMYCPDPLKAMREALRVLKPGGRAVFAVWGARKHCGWASLFSIVDARVQSTVCPLFFRLGGRNVLADEMTEAGFVRLAERRISSTLNYPDGEAAADAAFLGGPVALAYSRFDEATRREVRAEYLDSIRNYRTSVDYRISGEFVVCSGYKSVS